MKAREFWIQKDNKDIQTYEYFAHETQQYDDDIHAIEYSAYAELKADAQELAEALRFYSTGKHRPASDQVETGAMALIALSKWNEKYKGEK